MTELQAHARVVIKWGHCVPRNSFYVPVSLMLYLSFCLLCACYIVPPVLLYRTGCDLAHTMRALAFPHMSISSLDMDIHGEQLGGFPLSLHNLQESMFSFPREAGEGALLWGKPRAPPPQGGDLGLWPQRDTREFSAKKASGGSRQSPHHGPEGSTGPGPHYPFTRSPTPPSIMLSQPNQPPHLLTHDRLSYTPELFH